MKIKVFHIRLTKEHLHLDQEAINQFLESVTVKKTATQLINSQPNFWTILVFYEDKKTESSERKSEKITVAEDDALTETEQRIFEVLKQWRQDKANEMDVPVFMICHNSTLMTIAKLQPQNIEELANIKGFGPQRISKFGDEIIAVSNSI